MCRDIHIDYLPRMAIVLTKFNWKRENEKRKRAKKTKKKTKEKVNARRIKTESMVGWVEVEIWTEKKHENYRYFSNYLLKSVPFYRRYTYTICYVLYGSLLH